MNTALLQLFQPTMNNNRLFTESTSNPSSDFKQLIAQMDKSKEHSKDKLIDLLAGLLSEDSLMDIFNEQDAEGLLQQLQAFINGEVSVDNETLDELVGFLEKTQDDLDDISLSLFHSLKELVNELEVNNDNEQYYPFIDLNIQHNETVQLDAELSANIMQLISQIEQVFKQIHEGERMESVARQLLPLLQQWSTMNKQLPNNQLLQSAVEQLDAPDIEILEKVQKMYESRTHFQSKNMYGNNATVTRSDVAQWLTAVLNEPVKAEPSNRVIPVLNNEHLVTPRMSVLNQQAIYNSSMESVQRVEVEITQRIVTQIQQNMLLQATASQQSLSIRLAPEHLGTLNIQFTQVNGEMIVRIMTNSLATKEVLEANLHQLKHAFAPHQVQIVRDDTGNDEEMMSQQEEEQLAEENEQEHEEQLEEKQRDEQITIDFTSLIEELLAEEVEVDD